MSVTGMVQLVAVLAVALAGVLLANRVPIPAGALLMPMIATALLASTGLIDIQVLPAPLVLVTYVLIGWHAGLGFRLKDLRERFRPWVHALVLTVLMIVACFGLGLLLSVMTDATVLEGYLATTPGGIWIVVAIASDTGADLGLVATAQVLRVILMVLVIPILATTWLRHDRP